MPRNPIYPKISHYGFSITGAERSMTVAVDGLRILVGMAGLWLGALWLVESAARLARKLGVSDLVVGLTVVAFATSAPEFAVTVAAALRGQAEVSVANVVGSNLFNTGIILGGTALFAPIVCDPQMVKRDGGVLLMAMLVVMLFMLDARVVAWEGGVLLSLLIAYLFWLKQQGAAPEADELPSGEARWFDPLLLLAGLGIVVGAGELLVGGAVNLARHFGLSEWLIGVTVVAAGTSLPEAATSFVAVAKGRAAIGAGNVIGSNIFNLLGVLGAAALLKELPVAPAVLQSLAFLLLLTVTTVWMMRTDWRIRKREGLLLVGGSVACWVMDFLM